MFARVDFHWVNEGMMDKGQDQIANNTVRYKETGDVIARYKFMSQSDPLKVTTISIWKSKEAWEKAQEEASARRAASNPSDAPRPHVWAKIEGDSYDASQEI